MLATAACAAAALAAVDASAASAAAGSSSSSSFVLLRSLSCNKAISFLELTSLSFHVCLVVDVLEDVDVGQAFVEVCICNRCNAKMGGPLVG